jgi:hypothetical protein
MVEQMDRMGGFLDPWVFWGLDPIRERVFGKKLMYIAKQAIACMTSDTRREFWAHIDDRHRPETMPEVTQAGISQRRAAPTEVEVLTSMLDTPFKELPEPAQALLLAHAQKLWKITGDRACMPERIFTVAQPSNMHKFHIDPTCSHLPQPASKKECLLTLHRCEVCLKRERSKTRQHKAE